MEFWLQVVALIATPTATVAVLSLFGTKYLERLLDRQSILFEKQLQHKWEIQTSIQGALGSAYESLDGLLDQFITVVEQEVVSEHGSDSVFRRISYSPIEKFVDLWMPGLDPALEELLSSFHDARGGYHQLILLKHALDEQLTRDQGQHPLGAPPLSDAERALYVEALNQVRRDSLENVTKMVQDLLPEAFALLNDRGHLEFHEMNVGILKTFLNRKAVALLGPLDAAIRQFRAQLRNASRAFVQEHLT